MPAKKQITREKILAAAMALLRRAGLEAVSVTALAKELGCSTQPIYLSFPGMDALRAALGPLAVEALLAEITPPSGEQPPCLYGTAYLCFAQREKKLFQYLFLRPNAFAELRASLDPVMGAGIRSLQARFGLDWEAAHFLHDQLWMTAHGIASMIATDFCGWDMDKAARMLASAEEALFRKYGAS